MPAEDPSPRFVSNVISDFIVDQVSTNDTGLVIIPVAVGTGKTYAIADSVARCLGRGDDRRIFFLTPNKNPRGDFREAVLAACSSRGVSIGKDDVVMAESWEDSISNRLNRCDDGTVCIDLSAYAELENILSLGTMNTSRKKGVRKRREGERDRSKPFGSYWGLTVASYTALKSSYGEYRKYLLDSLSRFAFLFSTDEAHREFGKAALNEANDLLRAFRRTVSRCFWGDFESFIKRNGSDFGLDTETIVQAMLREKSSGWAWVRSAFPEVSYVDSRVMVMTNKKAVFCIDTVLFGTIDPYSSDSCIIFIDESDATKRDTLNTLIDQAVIGPVDFIRYCEGLNKRLDSTLGSASDIFDGALAGYRKRWEDFSARLSSLCEEESFLYSLKRVDEAKAGPLFFTPDVNGIGSRGRGSYSLYPDVENNKVWIRENSKVDDEKPRRSLDVANRKARGIFTSMAGLLYSHGEELARIRNGKTAGTRGAGFMARQLETKGIDSAMSSIVNELRLADSSVEAYTITRIAFGTRFSTRAKGRETGMPSVGGPADFTVYSAGCNMQRLADDVRHDTYTDILNFSIGVSPEAMLIKAASKNLVILASGTAVVEQIGNYDLDYVARGLNGNVILPDGSVAEELGRLADMRDAAADHYDIDVSVAPFPLDNPFDISSWVFLAPESDAFKDEVLRKLITPARLAIDPAEKDDSLGSVLTRLKRHFNILYSFHKFVKKPLCKSFLCITNAGVDPTPAHARDLFTSKSWKYSSEVLVDLMEHIARCFLPETLDARAWVEDAFMFTDSNALKATVARAHARLGAGGDAFLMLTYSAGSKALNLQYEIPKGVDVYPVPGMYPSTKKDWDGIYLESPTNKASDGGDEDAPDASARKLMGVYETLELEDRGDISRTEGRARMLGVLSGENHVEKWRFPSIRKAAAVDVNQALGRIDRTGNKTDTTVVLDYDLLDHIDADAMDSPYVKYNYTTPAWKALSRCISKGRVEQLEKGAAKYVVTAPSWESNARDAESRAEAFIDRLKPKGVFQEDGESLRLISWTFSPERQASYRSLGECLLAHPRGTMDDYGRGAGVSYRLMISDCSGLDVLYYSCCNEDFRDTHVSQSPSILAIEDAKRYGEVSERASRLPVITAVNGMPALLEKRGVATSWGAGDFMMSPVLFNNIYLGRLGEVVFSCWWETFMQPEYEPLTELPECDYELFDFKDPISGAYIDAKHFGEYTRKGDDVYFRRAAAKARAVGTEKVIYSNALSPKGREIAPRRFEFDGISFLEIPHVINDIDGSAAYWTPGVRDAYERFVYDR